MEKNSAQVSTTPIVPLDVVLMNFPEVRLGTIIRRVGWGTNDDRGGIIWTFRMPDGTYCMVSIGSHTKPKKQSINPKLATVLEDAWEDMGEVALGDANGGFNYASDKFCEFVEEAFDSVDD